ncbi:lysozyme inhibitor LprI family protein [Maricaulaceae bacterium NA33B04]|nr:lysozyme inhibitor LprI family protein [Maricaulaceae bacterium NA33B04]
MLALVTALFLLAVGSSSALPQELPVRHEANAEEIALIQSCIDDTATGSDLQACRGRVERACFESEISRDSSEAFVCHLREYEAWEWARNAAYSQLETRLQETAQSARLELLSGAREAWEDYQIAECDQRGTQGNPPRVYYIDNLNCWSDLLAQRTLDLNRQSAAMELSHP